MLILAWIHIGIKYRYLYCYFASISFFYYKSSLCNPEGMLRKARDRKFVCLRKPQPAPDFRGAYTVRYRLRLFFMRCKSSAPHTPVVFQGSFSDSPAKRGGYLFLPGKRRFIPFESKQTAIVGSE